MFSQIQSAKGSAVDMTNDYDKDISWVKVAPILVENLEVLLDITRLEKSLLRSVRAFTTATMIYSDRDISGQGIGVCHDDGKETKTTFAECYLFVREGNTSNSKDLSNLVDRLGSLKMKGGLLNVEMFMGTYNMVAEYAYYKGN